MANPNSNPNTAQGGVGEPELEPPQHRRRAKAVRAGQQARGAVNMYAAWPPLAMLAPATALPPSSCINAASASVTAAPSASCFIHTLALGLLALGREAHSALLAPRVPARWISGGRALREPRTEPQQRWAGASRTANRIEPAGRADFAKREPKWALFRDDEEPPPRARNCHIRVVLLSQSQLARLKLMLQWRAECHSGF